ncbi:hypothetical protein DSO57_1014811 [Entomophthora muscae]|uniref:Uncharacterized protein n=1 Tax=Entomophthora muscae TaxID=34485 RepID=A0ACC2RJU7_9FUNG|nr:hypothetical protein DSO57_1014811 [Entomophthora muscae]
MPALLSVLSSSNTSMQNARQQNSEPHQLRTSPSRDDHVEEHIKTGGSHDEEDACSTPYHNFSPSPQHRPVLGVRHSTHATSAENVRSATLLQASNPLHRELLPYKIHLCPVFWTCRSLKTLLCAPKSLTSQSSLPFFSLVRTSVLSSAQPKSSAQVPAASPGPSTETPQPSATEAAPPAHNAAPETEAPNKRPRVSYAGKLKSSFPNASTECFWRNKSHSGLTTHRKKLPTADRLQLVYVGSILRKPIREAKQNLMTWALTHALAQSLTSPSLAPPPASFSYAWGR